MKNDIALLWLRVCLGGVMLFSHGLPKLMNFSEKAATWADPIGFGPQVSLALAIFAEVFCSVAVICGVMTRWAAIPIVITMLVAAGIAHADDPWQKKELAVVMGIGFATIMIAGGGAFSVDRMRGQNPT